MFCEVIFFLLDANAAGENSEEEKENLLLRERMNKEYKRAVYVEGKCDELLVMI